MKTKYIFFSIIVILAVIIGGYYAYSSYYQGPHIKSINPANNEKNVTISKVVRINFTEPILAGSNFDNITISKVNGEAVNTNKSINGSILTIRNNGNYAKGATYSIRIPENSVKDQTGNPLENTKVYYFTITT